MYLVATSVSMMAATFGWIGEFEEGKEDWPQYVERFLWNNGGRQGTFRTPVGYRAECLQAAGEPHSPREARREILRGAGGSHDAAPSSDALGDRTTLQVPQSLQEAGREHSHVHVRAALIGRILQHRGHAARYICCGTDCCVALMSISYHTGCCQRRS